MSYLVPPTFHSKKHDCCTCFTAFMLAPKRSVWKQTKSMGLPCQSLLSMHLVHLLLTGQIVLQKGYWKCWSLERIIPHFLQHTESETPAMKKRLGLFLVIAALPLIFFWSITVSDRLSSENSEISPSHHQQNRLAHQHASEQVCKQRLPHSPLAAFASDV